MIGHDCGTEHGISGGLRVYAGDAADGHRIGRAGARLHLGHLGNAGHLPCLAEWTGGVVRCGLEHITRQHRAHGAGVLSAVAAICCCHRGSGVSPVFITGGNPVISERKQ